MKTYRWALLGLLLLLTAGGCATARTISRPIVDDGYNIVRAETWLDSERKPIPLGLDQPVTIGEEELKRILLSLRIVEPPGFLSMLILNAKPTPEPAFNDPEAGYLAGPLALALKSATPDERVVFFLHHQRSIYKGTTSSGIAFVKGGRFNLILGRYQMGNRPGSPDIAIGVNPIPETNLQSFYLEPGPFQSLVAESKSPGGAENVPDKRWVRIDYAEFLKAPTAATATSPTAPAEEATSAPHETGPDAATLEEKLKTLNRLKENGLITEEEYNEKRKELLKAF